MTAITTAGLLAGLFGSAFVPAARAVVAAASDLEAICSTTDADVDDTSPEADDAGDTCYVLGGKTIDITIVVENAGDGIVANTGTATAVGLTISSATADAVGTGTGLWSIAGNGKTATLAVSGTGAGVAADYDFTMKVVAPAAGSTGTLTIAVNTAGSDSVVITLIGVGSKATGVPSAAESTFDAACAFTVGTEQAAGGALCSASKVTHFDVDSEFGIGIEIEDGYGADVTTGYLLSATATGALGGIEWEADGDCSASDDASSASASASPNGPDTLCFNSDGESLGSGVITISIGTLSKTYKFGVIGTLNSLTLSAPAYIPAVANGDTLRDAWGDAFALTAKDAAGTVLGDGGGLAADVTEDDGDAGDGDGTGYSDGDINMTAANFSVLDENGASMTVATTEGDEDDAADDLSLGALEFADDLVKYIDAVDADDNYAVSEMSNNAYNVPVDLCGEDEEGETRTVSATSGTVTSNKVVVTCVSDDVKIISMTAKATGTSGSATAGKNGQTIKVEVIAQDGMGHPAGAGSSFAFTVAKSDGTTTALGGIASFSAGVATLTITLGTASGSQYVIYSATDSNSYTTAKEAFAQKVSYTVTNDADALTALSISTGPKGRVVTAAGFHAGELVKFEVENALTGVVRTYNRKANANGVATWRNATAALKYVTAIDSDDNLTDTISVKRK